MLKFRNRVIAGVMAAYLGVVAVPHFLSASGNSVPEDSLEKKLLSIKNPKGIQVFSHKEVLKLYIDNGGTYDYAKQLADSEVDGKNLTGPEVLGYFSIGISLDQIQKFVDRPDVPNSAIMLTQYDNYDADLGKGAFSNPVARNFFKTILDNYDVYARVVSDEDEIYKVLDFVPKNEMTVFAGHGDEEAVYFNKTEGGAWKPKYDKSTLDVSDSELKDHVKNFHRAVIFHFSCSNGKKLKDKTNIVDFVHSVSGMDFISGTEPFAASDIAIEKPHPLRARITVLGTDRTYTNVPSENKGLSWFPKY